MIKYFLIIISTIITTINKAFAVWNTYILDNLTTTHEETILDWVEDVNAGSWNLWILDTIINFFQDSISNLILLIALWVFIYIWINLVIAKWNPEDFKKYMLQFVYAAIWFFIVSAAWAIVKIVAWLNIG